MPVRIRKATLGDLDAMARLLVADARRREAIDPVLWRMDKNARDKAKSAVGTALENADRPFRQRWMIAEDAERAVGVAHTILLPVPPIYAGEFGPPGLIMEDCFVADRAPAGARRALLEAAETDLVEAGARILLAASVCGGAWEAAYAARGYEALTLYLAKVGLHPPAPFAGVRPARAEDVAAIAAHGDESRRILFDLDGFWKPHGDAHARFAAWMAESLSLRDRDMVVSEAGGALTGYAVAQPATALHFPSPHDIRAIGVMDDYHHREFSDPKTLTADGKGASDLLRAGEAALAERGKDAALVVCPAAWASKIAVLEAAGYRNAITWFKKRRDR